MNGELLLLTLGTLEEFKCVAALHFRAFALIRMYQLPPHIQLYFNHRQTSRIVSLFHLMNKTKSAIWYQISVAFGAS